MRADAYLNHTIEDEKAETPSTEIQEIKWKYVLADEEKGYEGNGFPKPKIYAVISSYRSAQFSRSVVSDPVDCSTPGFPAHYQLLTQQLTQTHAIESV